jgi:hypothetical protein
MTLVHERSTVIKRLLAEHIAVKCPTIERLIVMKRLLAVLKTSIRA